jgi:hypothetical protein
LIFGDDDSNCRRIEALSGRHEAPRGRQSTPALLRPMIGTSVQYP